MAAHLNGHEKRVTMSLARRSACCTLELRSILKKLPALDFDLSQLGQADVEVVYAEFDADLERRILEEWEVVLGYLVDLGPKCPGVCPLCGNGGLRFLFKVRNQINQREIETGSVCICTHKISVRGAETEDHARKILETMVRRHLRKLELEEWHEAYDFDAEMITLLEGALMRILKAHAPPSKAGSLIWGNERIQVFTGAVGHQLKANQLRRFYDRAGWLGTKKKWALWVKAVQFVRTHDDQAAGAMAAPMAWIPRAKAQRPSEVGQLLLAGVA